MLSFLIYEGKVAVALAVFYIYYRLLLKKETFHRFNRFVLVGAAVLSFLLPLCIITIHRPVEVLQVSADSVVVGGGEWVTAAQAAASTLWWQLGLTILFFAGVAFVLIRLLVSSLIILRMARQGEVVLEEDGCKVIVTDRDIEPFSWMNYIVLSQKDWEAPHAPILEHEKSHIVFGHSVELLLVDVLSALQWFNPAVWMLRADLQELHEYEADDAVLRAGTNIKEYQYLLIRKAVGKSGYSVANNFNHSILKNRITMMLKSRSPLSRGWKVLGMLPLMCLGLGLQARTVYVPMDGNDGKMVLSRNSQQKGADVVLYVRSDGSIECGDKEIALKDIAAHIRSLNMPFPETVVVIYAEADTPMGAVSDLKDELRKVGALRVQFSMPSKKADGKAVPGIRFFFTPAGASNRYVIHLQTPR